MGIVIINRLHGIGIIRWVIYCMPVFISHLPPWAKFLQVFIRNKHLNNLFRPLAHLYPETRWSEDGCCLCKDHHFEYIVYMPLKKYHWKLYPWKKYTQHILYYIRYFTTQNSSCCLSWVRKTADTQKGKQDPNKPHSFPFKSIITGYANSQIWLDLNHCQNFMLT